jgi:gamma-glutamyltranspeptidase/glutathione hydrolase
LQILREFGGNAADASVAIAAALAVLEPCSTGLGGDMFAMHYDASTHTVSAINGSGRSPAALSLDDVLQKQRVCEFGHRVDPTYRHSSITSHSNDLVTTTTTFETGVDTITVPGAAQGWEDVHHKFGSGRLTFSQLLEPAARLAECGFPVSTMTSKNWSDSMNLITQWYTPEEITDGKVELSIDGKGTGPKPGQIYRNVGLANVLRQLGQKGAKEGFYDGPPGKAIVDAIQRHGGSITVHDLINHSSTFVEPIHVEYHGINVWEVPPNGQGVAGLIALEGLNALEKNGMVESSSSSSSFNQDESLLSHHHHPPQTTVDMLHAQIEMMRLGFGDARAYVCDPDYVTHDKSRIDWLLNKERIHKRALDTFDVNKAVIHGQPDSTSCTVSFQVVDNDGNAMSFVNSNYMGFGTGLIPTNCGFTLHNRGAGFSLHTDHPNALGPSKRPYHTIIPAILTHADTDELYATLTNMGGFMQPQGHLQLVVNLLTYGMDPQTAIDAPRFCIADGTLDGTVLLEEGFHPDTIAKMEMMGHKMNTNISGHDRHWFGRAQIITRDRDTGVLCAGSDGRADGCALGY